MMPPPGYAAGVNNTGVLTNPEQLQNEHDILYYEQMPKPQELDEFAFMGQKADNPELFRLEEELGFGMDGAPSFNA